MRRFLLPALSLILLLIAACGESRSPLAPTSPASTLTIASLAVEPAEITGGTAVAGTLTLSAAAPAGGASVALSSNHAAASVPASVSVTPGATTATFAIATQAVATPTETTISGTLGGVTRTATLRVAASGAPSDPDGPVAAFGAKHDDVIGGTDSEGTITLVSPAPAGGTRITLSSSDPAIVDVPGAVTIAAGAKTATFQIQTRPVEAEREVAVTLTLAASLRARRAAASSVDHAAATATTLQFVLRVVPATGFDPTPEDEPSVPALTSLAPAQGVQGTSVEVTLTGTGFTAGATVSVTGSGVTVSDVVVASPASMTATLTIDAGAAIGARSVAVTTASGTSGAQTFTVGLAAPTLTGISPASAAQGQTVEVTLTGTNFVDGATVSVSGTGVTVSDVVVDATTITAALTVSGTAATGARTVTVTTPGGTTGAQTFTIVLPPAPTLSAFPVTPTTGLDGPTIGVTIAGTNFVAGATAVTVSGGITVSDVVVTSPTAITATFGNLTMSSETTFDVTVSTSGGSDTETVTSGAPITSGHSFEGFENQKCVEVFLAYEHAPGSETELVITQLPPRGSLFAFDATRLNNVGDPIAQNVPLPNNSQFCFVPLPHDHSIPLDAVYTTVLARTQSRTVVGTIEWSATISIYIKPLFFPPTLR